GEAEGLGERDAAAAVRGALAFVQDERLVARGGDIRLLGGVERARRGVRREVVEPGLAHVEMLLPQGCRRRGPPVRRPPDEPRWLRRACALSLVLHVVVGGLLWWWMSGHVDRGEASPVDIEMAPEAPKAEALAAEKEAPPPPASEATRAKEDDKV